MVNDRRPLLFLDIDGPLHPYATPSGTCPEEYLTVGLPAEARRPSAAASPRSYMRPETVWLNPAHGPALLSLGFELCWASAWMDDANRWIGPVLGLPPLPFVDFGEALMRERPDGIHWKSAPLVAHAGGRPFAWVDDEQTDADDAHITAAHRAGALLHHVNPRIGLRDEDFAVLAGFAATLHGSASSAPDPQPVVRARSSRGSSRSQWRCRAEGL
ncbi:hypothetical protein [Streptomyces rimosus]|uniref:hypothetical protein n=1 Tax=Streptomyces rimosus TaxID=1927 RepID=UPI0007C4F846|nr:hypothetical protein [Streptomyces rimosus]